ncbi:MAG: PolC-type DNA polymerase III, partial [Bacillota bacterium]
TVTLQHPSEVTFLNKKGYPSLLTKLIERQWQPAIRVIFDSQPEEQPDEYLQARDEAVAREIEELQRQSISASPRESRASEHYLGRTIHAEPIPLRDVQNERKGVVVCGQIISVDQRVLKNGMKLYTLDLTDYTDSITIKAFGKEKIVHRLGDLESGRWVKVSGEASVDKFAEELVIMADAINDASAPEIVDDAEEKRVELHAHTQMSAMDAPLTADALIKRAAVMGHKAIAITDHGVLQAYPEAAMAANKYKIKVVYGIEAYLVDEPDSPRSYHCIILVKNHQGLKDLYRLVTRAHLQYYHRVPRMVRAEIEAVRENLIIGSACEAGELYQAVLSKQPQDKLEAMAAFYDYLEIQPLGNNAFMLRKGMVENEGQLQEINCQIIRLGQSLGLPVVATGDVHFLEARDSIYRAILMAGQGYSDADDQAPLYMRTTKEMLAEFSYLPAELAYEVVIKNPGLIADRCETLKPIPDKLYTPKIEGAEEEITSMSYANAQKLYGEALPEIVSKRIKRELDSIINNGFAVNYMIAHKLVKKSVDDGYLVGSRGSVGSSLVATFTGITEVNPLPAHYRCPKCCWSDFTPGDEVDCGADLPDRECPQCGCKLEKDGFNIPFETFMGFDGDKVPDIDLNFSGEYQANAHKYTEELFGKDYVFRAGTIATVAERTAYGFVKNYLTERNMERRNAEINRLVQGCTGVKRTTGQHPGGLMVVPQDMDIHDFCPAQNPADDTKSDVRTTHFDYHSIHDCLLKLDLLGHDDPTVCRMLQDLTGIDVRTVPLDDPATMSLFTSTKALGVSPDQINSETGTFAVPEFGTSFVRQMLIDAQPARFSDLIRISGLSHGTGVWLDNAQSLIRDGVTDIGGVISTRDSIMLNLLQTTEIPPKTVFKISEKVRKGKGLTGEEEQLLRDNGVPEWYIQSCLKIQYLFPKAHAAAYVMSAFRIAYFKVHIPKAFYAAYFTVRADEFDADLVTKGPHVVKQAIAELERKGKEATAKEKALQTILEVAVEAMARGVTFEKIDLYRSKAKDFVITDTGLLPPLAALPG